MSVYQYPRLKRARAAEDIARVQELKDPGEQMGFIQGIKPGSIEEWRVAMAFWKYKIPFRYQVPIMGGRMVRGGQVIDFVVTRPYNIPVQVFGEHWHTGSMGADDRIKLALAEEYFKHQVVVFWGVQLDSQVSANKLVRRQFL